MRDEGNRLLPGVYIFLCYGLSSRREKFTVKSLSCSLNIEIYFAFKLSLILQPHKTEFRMKPTLSTASTQVMHRDKRLSDDCFRMVLYGIGWTVFVANDITTGGVPGIASIVYFATGLPVQYVYFGINAFLLLLSLKVLAGSSV